LSDINRWNNFHVFVCLFFLLFVHVLLKLSQVREMINNKIVDASIEDRIKESVERVTIKKKFNDIRLDILRFQELQQQLFNVEILKLKQEQTDLVEKLKNEKLENNYLSAPERVKKLAKLHLSPEYIEMDNTNFKYLNEK
jgi:BioD-like phosphotransacetylase family protein